MERGRHHAGDLAEANDQEHRGDPALRCGGGADPSDGRDAEQDGRADAAPGQPQSDVQHRGVVQELRAATEEVVRAEATRPNVLRQVRHQVVIADGDDRPEQDDQQPSSQSDQPDGGDSTAEPLSAQEDPPPDEVDDAGERGEGDRQDEQTGQHGLEVRHAAEQ